jgi:hypothetical protein
MPDSLSLVFFAFSDQKGASRQIALRGLFPAIIFSILIYDPP